MPRLLIALLLLCGSAPVLLAATAPTPPQSIWVTARTDTTLTITWFGAVPGANPIASYVIRRDGVQSGTATATSWSDAGLAAGSAHTYTVTAIDSVGAASAASAALAVTTLPAGWQGPAAPAGVAVAGITATTISLTWGAVGGTAPAVRYLVYLNGTLAANVAATSATCPLPVLAPGSAIAVTVVAVDAQDNHSAASAAVNASVPADTSPPTAPGSVTVSAITASTAKVAWTAASDNAAVASYTVAWQGASGSGTATATATATECILGVETARLVPGTAYSVTVTAIDTAGLATAAAAVAFSTPADASAPTQPAPPTLGSITFTTLTVQWTAAHARDDVGIATWELSRDGTVIATRAAGSGLYWTDSPTPGTSHAYTLVAIDAAGRRSAASPPLQVALPMEGIAPPAPVAIRVVGRTATSLTLDWTQDGDAGGSGLAYYTVERDGVVIAARTTAKPFTDTTPTLAAHTYVVRAVDGSGNVSAPSQPRTVQRGGDLVPPTAPGAPTASAVTATGLSLGWTAATDAVGVVGYEILRDGVRVGDTATRTWADGGLVPGSVHAYAVRAYDAAANRSPASSATSVTLLADTTAPTVPGLPTASAITATSLALAWSAASDNVGVVAYEVLRDGTLAATVTAPAWSDSGLVPGSTHGYSVRAVDVAGNRSGAGAVRTVALPADTTPPEAPQAPWSTSLGAQGVGLAWQAAADDVATTTYEVRRNGVAVATTAALAWSDSGLSDGTAYAYALVAIDAAGNRSAVGPVLSLSTPVDPGIDHTPPTPPTLIQATDRSASTIALSWVAAVDETSRIQAYRVIRDGAVVGTSGGNAPYYTDGGLLPGHDYVYQVSASDVAGNWSTPSLPATLRTGIDATAPTVPTGLRVTAVTAVSASLAWTAASDDVAVTGYEVLDAGGSPLLVASGTSAAVTGLRPGTAYPLAVRACDAAGNRSAASTAVTATTSADTVAPGVPGGVAAAVQSPSAIRVTWTAASDNVGVASYNLRRGATIVASLPGTAYVDTGLTPVTAYAYTVQAVDYAGLTSGWSTNATATTGADVTAPSAPTRLWSSQPPDRTHVYLQWSAGLDAIGVAGYRIYDNASQVASTAGNLTAAVLLPPGHAGRFTVRAVDAAGNLSPDSPQLLATTLADTVAPPAPCPTASGRTATAVTVVWNAVTDDAGVVNYRIRRDGVQIAIVPAGGASYGDSGLATGSTHVYVVRAVDDAGNESSPDFPLSITLSTDTTPPADPVAPTSPSRTATSIALAWPAASDNVGVVAYEVFVDGVRSLVAYGTSCTCTGLAPGTTHAFSLLARDAAGNISAQGPSLSVATTADAALPQPASGLAVASRTSTSVTLAWTAGSDDTGVAGYEILANGGLVGTTTGTTFTHNSIGPDQTRTYTVQIRDLAGKTAAANPSLTAATLPDTTAPSAPTPVWVASAGQSSIELAWSPANDDYLVNMYEVRRNGTVMTQIGTRSWTDYAPPGGGAANYEVIAIDYAGNRSAPASISASPAADSSLPMPPTALRLTARSDASLSLAWNAGSDGGSGVAGYEVALAGTVAATVTTASATLGGLRPDTAYSVTVRTLDLAGNRSAWCPAYSIRTQTDSTPPAAPAVTISGIGPVAATATWAVPADNGTVVSYLVTLNGTPVATTAATSIAVPGVRPGCHWQVDVYAFDAAGNRSDSLPTVFDSPIDTTLPGPPVGLAATTPARGTVALTWQAASDASGIGIYFVYRDGTRIGSTIATAWTDTTATPGALVGYQVVAADTCGNLSTPAALTTTVPDDILPPWRPARPVTIAVTPTGVSLAWGAVHDDVAVASYRVLRNGTEAGSTAGTTWSDDGRTPGTSVAYAIVAVDAAGNRSPPSPALTVSLPADTRAPSVPQDLALLLAGTTSVRVGWAAASDAGGSGLAAYEVASDGAVVATTTARQADIGGLAAASVRRITVVAIDAAGNHSAPSAPLYVRTAATAGSGLPAWNADTTPPAAPAAATAVVADPRSIAITWPAVAEATCYLVSRSPASGGAATWLGLAQGTAFTDPEPPGNADWVYLVQACDGPGNESPTTATAAIRLPSDTTPPPAALNLRMGRPLPLLQWVEVVWDAPADTSDIVAWDVPGLGRLPPSARSAIVGLPPGSHTASVVVTSVDRHGNAAYAYLTTTPALDITPPSPPTSLVLDLVRIDQVRLSWTAAWDESGLVSCRILRNGTDLGVASASYIDTAVVPGAIYRYEVVAVDAAGNRTPGPAVTATIPGDTTAPTAPGAPAWASRSGGGLVLVWPPASDGAGRPLPAYRIVRDGRQVGSTAAGVATWSDAGLAPGIAYAYAITAVDAAGNLTAGAAASLRSAPASVILPRNLRPVTTSPTTLTLAWDPPDGVVGLTTWQVTGPDGTAQSLPAATTQATCAIPAAFAVNGATVTVAGSDAAGNATGTASWVMSDRSLSLLQRTAAFDAGKWSGDAAYRQAWLGSYDPARVFLAAEPSGSVPVLRSEAGRRWSGTPGQNITLGVVGAAGAPVTFVATGAGSFAANGLNVITIAADAGGMARVAFIVPAAGTSVIRAASPLASGAVRFAVRSQP